VERVVLRGNPLVGRRTDRPEVSTGTESQVSAQHAIAAALVQGQASLAQFADACVRDPAVIAMRRKVEVVCDDAIPTIAGQVETPTADGKTHRLSTPAARGSAQNPMADREIEEKLRTIAAAWRPDYDVAPLIDAVWGLDGSDDVSQLLALTVP